LFAALADCAVQDGTGVALPVTVLQTVVV